MSTDTKKKSKGRKVLASVDEPLNPGIVYVGHIPHGFYEEEMKGFFSQFGTVKGVRVSRNKKTGRPKGYGFVKFACDEVAKIAAETMNNYLMFNKLLKCQFVDPERVHFGTVGGRRRIKEIRASIRLKRAQRKHNQPRNVTESKYRVSRLLSREKRKRRKLEALGIDYKFPGYSSQVSCAKNSKASSHTLFVDSDSEE